MHTFMNFKEDASRSICSTVQLKLREMQYTWLSARAEEIQGYAVKNEMKNFYISLKESTVQPVPALLCFWVQIEPSSYQRKMSQRGELIISIVYETGHLLSTTRPFNGYRKSKWMKHSMSLQAWGIFR